MPDYPVQSGTQDNSPEVVEGLAGTVNMTETSDLAAPGWHPIMYPTAGEYGTSEDPATGATQVAPAAASTPISLPPDQEN